MPESLLMTLDGRFHDPGTPFLHVDNFAVLRGDGIFETALVQGGRALKVDAHLQRLARSAQRLDLPPIKESEWKEAIDVATQRWGSTKEGVLRCVLSRGRESDSVHTREATSFLYLSEVTAATVTKRTQGVSALLLERGFAAEQSSQAPWLLLGAKTLSYAMNMAALRYAASHGADEVIFIDTSGKLLEGPTASVLVTHGNTLRTPPWDQGILEGTTLQALFHHAEKRGWKCLAEPLTEEDLFAAEGVWLTSSITVCCRVHTVEGKRLHHPDTAVDLRPLVQEAVSAT